MTAKAVLRGWEHLGQHGLEAASCEHRNQPSCTARKAINYLDC
jgi:hypothetical protein